MKLSFSVSSSKPSSRTNPSSQPQPFPSPHDSAAPSSPSRLQYVTVFDPSQTLTPSAKPVISPLVNTDQWRASKRMKNLIPPSAETPSDSTKFVADRLGIDSPQAAPSYGLTIRSKAPDVKIEDDPTPPVRVKPTDESHCFKAKLDGDPDDRGIEEFQEVSVEEFGRALLRGYGWKEGGGIGGKEDVKVVEQRRWVGTSGFGFEPKPPTRTDNEDKGKSGRDGKPPPAPTLRANSGVKDEVVRVVAGKYAGMKGEVLKSGKDGVVLRLLRSGEKVSVGDDMIAQLGSFEEERCLKKLKANDGSRDKRGREDARKSGRAESELDSGIGRSSGFRKDSDGSVHWLRSQIKVRIIDKNFKRGRLYLKKGVVMDVVDPVTCDVSMDETRELLQGVDQEVLETVLPHRGGPVIVLYGRHKGIYGKLVEKDKEREIATIRDADNQELIKVRMEQIAEFVGDPDDIGY